MSLPITGFRTVGKLLCGCSLSLLIHKMGMMNPCLIQLRGLKRWSRYLTHTECSVTGGIVLRDTVVLSDSGEGAQLSRARSKVLCKHLPSAVCASPLPSTSLFLLLISQSITSLPLCPLHVLSPHLRKLPHRLAPRSASPESLLVSFLRPRSPDFLKYFFFSFFLFFFSGGIGD